MILRSTLTAASFCIISSCAQAFDLTVTVEGLRSNEGQIFLCVFSGATWGVKAAFPECDKERTVRKERIFAGSGNTVVTFYGLSAGEYAVAMNHDENGNGRLDTSPLGDPQEGFGVSNNLMLLFGAPSYEAAKFYLNDSTSITIRARYPLIRTP
jgi:uncharacterized protein (DUF2141 family)